jgi:hypothetical protein
MNEVEGGGFSTPDDYATERLPQLLCKALTHQKANASAGVREAWSWLIQVHLRDPIETGGQR